MILTVKDADMSWAYQTFYYINTATKKVVKVVTTNSTFIRVSDHSGNEFEIALAMDDTCTGFDQGEAVCSGAGKAAIKGLELSGKMVEALDQPQVLTCYGEGGGLRNCFNEGTQFAYNGINKDLTKIYFSLVVTKNQMDNKEILRHENFSYDVEFQKIMTEKPQELLQVSP
jgi:hypothetical protein